MTLCYSRVSSLHAVDFIYNMQCGEGELYRDWHSAYHHSYIEKCTCSIANVRTPYYVSFNQYLIQTHTSYWIIFIVGVGICAELSLQGKGYPWPIIIRYLKVLSASRYGVELLYYTEIVNNSKRVRRLHSPMLLNLFPIRVISKAPKYTII